MGILQCHLFTSLEYVLDDGRFVECFHSGVLDQGWDSMQVLWLPLILCEDLGHITVKRLVQLDDIALVKYWHGADLHEH